MKPPVFELVALERLREHEQVDRAWVESLAARIKSDGILLDPIWVSREGGVILNGHHRYHALVSLGAHRIPAWVFDYDDPTVRLERWSPGPVVTKAMVIEQAERGDLFPPKTTKHTVLVELPERPTPLSVLLSVAPPQDGPAGPAAAPGIGNGSGSSPTENLRIVSQSSPVSTGRKRSRSESGVSPGSTGTRA